MIVYLFKDKNSGEVIHRIKCDGAIEIHDTMYMKWLSLESLMNSKMITI